MMPHRPAAVCQALLCAIEAAEGRRRNRKRDQTPDAIGLTVKRELLARIVEADPSPADFEGWLLEHAAAADAARAQDPGAIDAMARAVLDEWRMVHDLPAFAHWLEDGAPSEDAR